MHLFFSGLLASLYDYFANLLHFEAELVFYLSVPEVRMVNFVLE